MKTRIITAIIAIALFVPICYFSSTIIFPIAIGILCAVGVYEVAKCIGQEKNYIVTIPMYIIALALPIIRHNSIINTNSEYLLYCCGAVFSMLIYCMAYVMLKKHKESASNVLTLYSLFLYVVGCFSSIVMVRYTTEGGKYMYILIFLGAWVCDTFAYFVGRLFGKHKLIPEISPKKTVEGSIGGIIFTLIAFLLYGLLLKNYFNYEIPYFQLCILGVLLPIISQIGDLVASCVKRQYNIKDYGKIFPGHGGVLDRFDSVMLVAPVLCIINAIISLF